MKYNTALSHREHEIFIQPTGSNELQHPVVADGLIPESGFCGVRSGNAEKPKTDSSGKWEKKAFFSQFYLSSKYSQ